MVANTVPTSPLLNLYKVSKTPGTDLPTVSTEQRTIWGEYLHTESCNKRFPRRTQSRARRQIILSQFHGKMGSHTLLLMTIGSVHRRSNGCKVSARVSGSCIMRLTNWPSTRYPDQRSQAWLFFVCSNTILNVRIFLAKFFCHLEEQYRRARFSHHDRYEDAVDTSDSARKELVQVMAFSHVRT